MSLSRLTYILYIGILLVAVVVLYFVIAEYVMYANQLPKEDIIVNVTSNEVQSFADGFHPVLVIDAAAREKSIIQIKLASAAYSTQYSSGDYVNNYTTLAILPTNTFSTDFNITATATDNEGNTFYRKTYVKTGEEQKVVFGVR
jgi:hypothetical protein